MLQKPQAWRTPSHLQPDRRLLHQQQVWARPLTPTHVPDEGSAPSFWRAVAGGRRGRRAGGSGPRRPARRGRTRGRALGPVGLSLAVGSRCVPVSGCPLLRPLMWAAPGGSGHSRRISPGQEEPLRGFRLSGTARHGVAKCSQTFMGTSGPPAFRFLEKLPRWGRATSHLLLAREGVNPPPPKRPGGARLLSGCCSSEARASVGQFVAGPPTVAGSAPGPQALRTSPGPAVGHGQQPAACGCDRRQ